MRITIRTFTTCILASLLLTACGSSPQVRYFTLSTSVPGAGQDTDDAVALGFGPLRVPEYLNRSQFVTRGAGAEIQVDEFSRWAEPLDQALHRVVAADLDSLVDGVTVIEFPYEEMVRAHVDYRLLGDILRFDADATGRVVLETKWAIARVDADVLVKAQRRIYEARVGSPGDPGSIAEAMNQAVAKFSRDIAARLESALQE